jgi:uncharacterized membrane protein
MKTLRLLLDASALCALSTVAAAAATPAYLAQAIDPPPPAVESQPSALNVRGQVVGSFYSRSTHGLHAYATRAHGRKAIDICPDLAYCGAYAINARGWVAGFRRDETGPTLFMAIVMRADGSGRRELGTLGGNKSVAKAVNAFGAVAGQSNLVADGPLHGFFTRRAGGPLRDLGTLGGDQSFVWSMNDWNDVVGEAQLPDVDTWHAFVAPHGRLPLRDLGTLGGSYSSAYHVTDSGWIVGGSTRADGTTHAFIGRVEGGELTDLGALVNWSFAMSANDRGTVVGGSDKPDGSTTAFVVAGPGSPMIELSTVTQGLPAGVGLSEATDVNAQGEITALGTDNHSYLLRPSGQ